MADSSSALVIARAMINNPQLLVADEPSPCWMLGRVEILKLLRCLQDATPGSHLHHPRPSTVRYFSIHLCVYAGEIMRKPAWMTC